MVRFGMISWLPIYSLTVKTLFKRTDERRKLFECKAIPSTLPAGWLSDKLLKGRRMPRDLHGADFARSIDTGKVNLC